MNKIQNIALFIDGDNVCKNTFEENYDDIKLKGRISIKRIYFDYNNKIDEKWKFILLNNGIDSINVTNLPQKNSTDIRLMLDMLVVFYNNPNIDTFVIMSSDSDFYHIATFIRSVGKTIICYGEEKTPKMLRNVVDEFILCKTPVKKIKYTIEQSSKNQYIKKDKNINLVEINNKKKDSFSSDKDKEDDSLSDEEESDEEVILTEENKIYEEIIKIDTYVVDSNKIKNINWKKYEYYIEYKDKIYIIRDLIDKIKFICSRRDLLNKNLSILKDLLKLSDTSFSEKNWNFNSFKIFIQTLFTNKIEIVRDVDKKYEIIAKINF